ncbi:hypothetical protein RYA05_02970 [Pseudomonas syringae pv. actinidiae]|nr:hypothetical protein [Pseudomonas syringae pv. actinidiae]
MPFYTAQQREILGKLGFREDDQQDYWALLKPFQKYVHIVRPENEDWGSNNESQRADLYQIRSGKLVYASGPDPVELAVNWIRQYGNRLRDPIDVDAVLADL